MSKTHPASREDVVLSRRGVAGHILLNRPHALNAITYEMLQAMSAALRDWSADDDVQLVVIEGAGERAFAAGGDIQQIYAHGLEQNFQPAADYFTAEYRLDAQIASFPKPYVALMDGIAMGGGVGVSSNGSHAIVTERTLVAMPECGIGLVPDAGGSYILAKAPGRLGEYCGLTGARLGPADAIEMGFAGTFVPAAGLGALCDELCEAGDVTAIERAATTPPPGVLAGWRAVIDDAFAASDVPAIIARLHALGDTPPAQQALNAIRRGSPLSLVSALEIIRRNRDAQSIEAGLALEYRFTHRALEHADFREGVRAAVIDKDRRPKWSDPDPSSVSPERVAAMLAPPAAGEWTA